MRPSAQKVKSELIGFSARCGSALRRGLWFLDLRSLVSHWHQILSFCCCKSLKSLGWDFWMNLKSITHFFVLSQWNISTYKIRFFFNGTVVIWDISFKPVGIRSSIVCSLLHWGKHPIFFPSWFFYACLGHGASRTFIFKFALLVPSPGYFWLMLSKETPCKSSQFR